MSAERGLLSPQSTGQIVPTSLTEKLENERHQLEQRLGQVNEALNALHDNPEAQKLFDAVAKLGHLGY